ncbi:hypothetical protein ACFXJ5_27170 [Streptomyces sp. NPDC059373]
MALNLYCQEMAWGPMSYAVESAENPGCVRYAVALDPAEPAAGYIEGWVSGEDARRRRDDHGLLDGPSARYPEVRFFS